MVQRALISIHPSGLSG